MKLKVRVLNITELDCNETNIYVRGKFIDVVFNFSLTFTEGAKLKDSIRIYTAGRRGTM